MANTHQGASPQPYPLSMGIFISYNVFLVYTIAYGVPEPHDSLWGWKVFGGTMGVIAAGCGLFALARSFGITNYYFLFLIDYLYLLLANPPPRTLSPEYQRAMEEYMRSQNLEPFNGISAQKQSQPSIDELRIA